MPAVRFGRFRQARRGSSRSGQSVRSRVVRGVLRGAALVVVAALVWGLWAAYAGWRTSRDLMEADRALGQLSTALADGDIEARDAAVRTFTSRAAAAANRTNDWTWTGLGWLPAVGDDVKGVSALSASLDALAQGALGPLLIVVDALDGVSGDGGVDIAAIKELRAPLGFARAGAQRATDLVDGYVSDGYVSELREPFDDYSRVVSELTDGLVAAESAAEVIPQMLGGEGPRDYLLVFQNNAEIRATGGLAGSWARVHAEDGVLTMEEQGSGTDFPTLDQPVVPLTEEELALYGPEIGRFFRNPGFTPDFTRAARIFQGFWDRYADIPIDGVVAVDPVALSYVLAGTGPVDVEGTELTSQNASDTLLSQIYAAFPDPDDQDAAFEGAARAIFTAATSDLDDPIAFAKGLLRATREQRFLVSSFDQSVQAQLEGQKITGDYASASADEPRVDIGLNDATGAKMSYYLRYDVGLSAVRCADGVQVVAGSMRLWQTITPEAARALPAYVNGGGVYGTRPGGQLVVVRIYGPAGGRVIDVAVDGVAVDVTAKEIDGRPVVTLPRLVDEIEPQEITWSVISDAGQVGDIALGVTTGVSAPTWPAAIPSAC